MSSLLASKSDPQTQRGGVEIIRCGLGEEIFCLEMSAVAGVKPSCDLLPAQDQGPEGSVGTIRHGEQDVPVFDLADLLKLPHDPAGELHYTVLIDHPRQMFALRMESVSRVIRLSEENVLPLPKPLAHTRRWFRGIVDFSRDQSLSVEAYNTEYLPGVSTPRPMPSNRRQLHDQMKLLLNPLSLCPGVGRASAAEIPAKLLLARYAQAAPLSQQKRARQIVMYPAGVIDDRQLLIGLSISQIAEISEPLPVSSVPGQNKEIQGLTQWRSCPVPVINLQASLNYEAEPEPVSHLLIVRDPRSQELVALPVSGRLNALRLPIEHRPAALPHPAWKRYTLGCFELEERLLILPRIDTLSGLEL